MGTHITDVDGRTPELPPDRDVPLVGPFGGKSWTDSCDVEQAGELTRGSEGIREAYAGHVLLNEESLGRGPWPTRGIQGQVAGPHLVIYAKAYADYRRGITKGTNSQAQPRIPVISVRLQKTSGGIACLRGWDNW